MVRDCSYGSRTYKMDKDELEAFVERLSFATSTTVRFVEDEEVLLMLPNAT